MNEYDRPKCDEPHRTVTDTGEFDARHAALSDHFSDKQILDIIGIVIDVNI